MAGLRRTPHAAQQTCDDGVVFRLGQSPETRAWLAPFKEHGTEFLVGIEQMNTGVAVGRERRRKKKAAPQMKCGAAGSLFGIG
jgi:hypothetical protein